MSLLKTGRPSSNKAKTLEQMIDKKDTMKMNINIAKDFHKQVKRFALDQDITVTDLILTSLHEYMKK